MDNRIDVLREEIKQKIAEAADLAELDKLRVSTLGKKGSITALLKGMKNLSNEERKTFGAEVNKLKASVAEKIEKRVEVLNQMAIEAPIIRSRCPSVSAKRCSSQWASPSRIIPRSSPTTNALSRSTSPSTIPREICRTPTISRTVSF